ncbi:MAG: tRNA (N6-isopentenyl adenosine(37)-C2)-methylthiotransferase MiaB, partial [Aquificaceae bacterium]|nr:tRNA (N6-isopentenyl adenosine(37)-C2)-methylthiotransferase MiaB [Aquificaceae bacterium]
MKYFVKTFGCQMNVSDSERIRGILESMGFEKAESIESANVVLLNTCTIREKPDQKVFSLLGELKKLKQKNGTIIGVCGCLAQRMGESLLHKAPEVDVMFSSFNIHNLGKLIEQAQRGFKAIEILDEPPEDENELWKIKPVRDGQVCAYVTVMKGCDKSCTYCVVPKTRGRQRSRSLESILEEVRELSSIGVREVHLLGQNVTAWGQDINVGFDELLRRVCEVDGIWRVRFTTGHPKDMTIQIAKAMGELSKVCPHLHLPFQAGSDRILSLMQRGYTRDEYLSTIEMLKEHVKGISFSTDVIVGFPSETEEDFYWTLEVLKKVEFEQVFSFKFSPRPETPAFYMESQVPDEEKTRRTS